MTSKAKLSKMKEDIDNANKEKKDTQKTKSPESLEYNIPRDGGRKDFLKITITIPADLLSELRALGMKRKANKMKDTDTSSLIREAVIDLLRKNTSH